MKMTKLILPALALGLAACSASAATSHWEIDTDNIVPNTVAYALFADGQGDDWTGAVLRVDLSSGSVYNHGSGGDSAPSSAFIGFVPELEFDSYVGIIDDGTAGIAGGAGDLGGGLQSLDGPQISMTWFNTAIDNTGPIQIGNITLSDDAAGTWQLIVSFANGQVQSSGFFPVPEPATLSLMGLGGMLALRRR